MPFRFTERASLVHKSGDRFRRSFLQVNLDETRETPDLHFIPNRPRHPAARAMTAGTRTPNPGQSARGAGKRTDVPMTRPEESLAALDGIGTSAAFAELSDGRIIIARGEGRFSWSSPMAVSPGPNPSARDTAGEPLKGQSGDHNLIRLAGNGLGFVDRQGPYPDQYLMFWRSEDGGKTWQKPIRITPPSLHGIAALNDVIIRTSSGRIVLPVYGFMEQGRDLHKRGGQPTRVLFGPARQRDRRDLRPPWRSDILLVLCDVFR